MRTSYVRHVDIVNMIFACTLFVGDLDTYSPTNFVFAVQRQLPNFLGTEIDLKKEPFYRYTIPKPYPKGEVVMNVIHEAPSIFVDKIDVIAMSSSCAVHIGNRRVVDAEARIKHIRQMLYAESTR